MDHSNAIYISDLGQCTPKAALTAGHQKYRWQTVPYEAEGVSGVMVHAGPETEVPPITLPLGVSGWHAVFIGLYSNISRTVSKVRLSGDRAYCWLEREEETVTVSDPVYAGSSAGRVNNYVIDERYWKSADLTGQDIVIAQEMAYEPRAACVAYVKLVPLSNAEVSALQTDRGPAAETRRLIFMNDAFSDYTPMPYHDPRQEIWDWLEPYRDTDFKTLLWCAYQGDVAQYSSRLAPTIGSETTDYPRTVDRLIAEALQVLEGKGYDALREVVEYCHSMGIDVHVSNRMEAFQCSPPFEEFFTGHLYREHPEWRCIDIDGREIARMSYVFEGVRDVMLNIFREYATDYDIDGINPIFNRGAPFLLYEQPLVDGFKQETGLDARQFDERDERYLRYRAGVMTEFMRTLRREMDAIGERRGRKIEITAHVLSNEQTNMFYALDVPAWIQEGLIDNLVSYPWREIEPDVEYFAKLAAGTPVRYFPDVMPRRMPPEEYRKRAIDLYATGAAGLCFWDTNGRDHFRREFSMIARLGHIDKLTDWDDGDGEYFRTVKLYNVGGYVLDKYPPHWAY